MAARLRRSSNSSPGTTLLLCRETTCVEENFCHLKGAHFYNVWIKLVKNGFDVGYSTSRSSKVQLRGCKVMFRQTKSFERVFDITNTPPHIEYEDGRVLLLNFPYPGT